MMIVKNKAVHSNWRGLCKRLISADSYNLRAGKKYKNKSHPRKNKRFGRLKKLLDDPRGQVHPQSLCKPTPPPRCWVFLDLAATSSPSMPPQPGIGLLITHPTLHFGGIYHWILLQTCLTQKFYSQPWRRTSRAPLVPLQWQWWNNCSGCWSRLCTHRFRHSSNRWRIWDPLQDHTKTISGM